MTIARPVRYTVRTARWRYTEWLRWDRENLRATWDEGAVARELYDHAGDDGLDMSLLVHDEHDNLAYTGTAPKVADALQELHALLRAEFDKPPAKGGKLASEHLKKDQNSQTFSDNKRCVIAQSPTAGDKSDLHRSGNPLTARLGDMRSIVASSHRKRPQGRQRQ